MYSRPGGMRSDLVNVACIVKNKPYIFFYKYSHWNTNSKIVTSCSTPRQS